jgi:hypothetical protein
MKNTLLIINDLKSAGLIKRYAITGGMAALFYVEPLVTFDLDLLVLVPDEESLNPLASISEYLGRLGYPTEGEHLVVEGIPVQFLLPYNDLTREALERSQSALYDDLSTPVVSVEFLMAIMVQTWRAKDRQRLVLFLEEAHFDNKLLREILVRHQLEGRWEQWIGNNTSDI